MVGAHFVSIHDPTNKAACRIKQSEMMDVLFLATTASWGLNISSSGGQRKISWQVVCLSKIWGLFQKHHEIRILQSGPLPAISRVITPLTGVIAPFITSRGPSCVIPPIQTLSKMESAELQQTENS